MRRPSGSAVVVVAAFSACRALALPAPVPTERDFQRMAEAALDACERQGIQASVAVVDAEGLAKVTLRADGAGLHTPQSALHKAFTAASFGLPTGRLAVMAAQKPTLGALQTLDGVLFVPGGLPIMVGDTVVGAIGVAGGRQDGQDEGCARAGLEAMGKAPG